VPNLPCTELVKESSAAKPSSGSAVDTKKLLLAAYSSAAACHLFSVFGTFLDVRVFQALPFHEIVST
jgi:hypothetical protein